MKKPTPISKDVPFEFEELFFSTTNHHGNIQFGNEVFLRVSGYPKDVIIGAPHNIIRHPDMPKSVFKLFWRYLKENKPIGAYVKNMASDGAFYWVFAFAFPIETGYLSIRFKPSSELFVKVQEIYKSILESEKSLTPEEGEKLLLKIIQENGFTDYDDFMIKAAIEEHRMRELNVNISSKIESNLTANFLAISDISSETASKLNNSFDKIGLFQNNSRNFLTGVNTLESEFNKLNFLSINMKISAGNLGDSGSTLSVVSEEFSKLALNIEKQLSSFSELVTGLDHTIKLCSLHLTALKTQMILVNFFVKESIAKSATSDEAFSEMLETRESFTSLFSNSILALQTELKLLNHRVLQTTQEIKEIQKFISGLEVIKQTGAIEASRKESVKQSFDYYLAEMDDFTNILRKTITDFGEQRDSLLLNSQIIMQSTSSIAGNINQLFELALKNT